MAWVFAVPVVGFVVFLVVGAITGHVKVKSCCGIADPRCDARLRGAFLDPANATKPARPADGGYAD
ncbi:MAG TPA: hypothetical protein VFQ01_09640 [Nocardioides sp.]|jgi:hypothetical protein|nr:hypothetical protein [Nocardioides sp.]